MKKSSALPKPVSEYDLRLLRVFRVVVECGGFSAAEQALNISRSTISVHISNLEKRMNVRLARRGRGGFALTEKGKTIYEGALKLFESLNEFAWMVDGLDDALSGELSILCSDEVALARQLRLPETIAWIHEKAPKLQIALNSDTVPNIENALLNGSAHVGIVPEFRTIDGLEYRPGYEDFFYLCCGARHPLYHRSDDSISDEEFAACAAAHPGVDVNRAGIEQLQSLNLSARAYQFDTRTPLILSGCYLGFFPMSYIQGFIERKEVRLLQPEKRRYKVNHVFVHRQERTLDTKIELFYQAQRAVGLHTE